MRARRLHTIEIAAAVLSALPGIASAAIAPITSVMLSAIDRGCMPWLAHVEGWPDRPGTVAPSPDDLGLFPGASPAAAAAMGASGRQLVAGATLATSPPYPDGSFLVAVDGRSRVCRLLMFGTDLRGAALAARIADVLTFRPQSWVEVKPEPGATDRRFVAAWQTPAGVMRQTLTLRTSGDPRSGITAVITIAAPRAGAQGH